MVGLPYDSTSNDVVRFFGDLKPVEVKMGMNNKNRPTGFAIARFHDEATMKTALEKCQHKFIQSRWIDLIQAADGEYRNFTALYSWC